MFEVNSNIKKMLIKRMFVDSTLLKNAQLTVIYHVKTWEPKLRRTEKLTGKIRITYR
jgi:hypothetical protein